MKKFFKSALYFSVIGVSMFAASCSDDETAAVAPVLPPEDGIYVVGGTQLPSISLNGMMVAGINEVNDQKVRAELSEGFFYLDGDFSIIEVNGATQTTYGPAADFAAVTKQINEEPKPSADFKRGSFEVSTNKFTIGKAGVYHVAIDKGVMKAVVVPVDHWSIVGAAAPGGWEKMDTIANVLAEKLALPAFAFEGKDIKLVKGNFKFRHSNAWKVTLDTNFVNPNAKKGIKINTNAGADKSFTKLADGTYKLVPGGEDMNSTYNGKSTVTFSHTSSGTFAYSVVVTTPNVVVDYSTYKFGIVGNSFYKIDGKTKVDWNYNWSASATDQSAGTVLPTKVGTVYTWKWEGVKMVNAGEWKIRQNEDWAGKSFGYGVDVRSGAAWSDFSDKGGNILVTNAADTKYDITLIIDATSEIYTIDAVKSAVQ